MTASALALALLAHAALSAPPQGRGIELTQETPDGWIPVAFEPLPPADPPAVRRAYLPRVTRSEVVTRAHVVRDRARLRIEADAGTQLLVLQGRWIPHAADEQVLAHSKVDAIVGLPYLPRRVTANGVDVQPWTARQDGNTVDAGLLRVGPPPAGTEELGLALVAIGAPGCFGAPAREPEPGVTNRRLFSSGRALRFLDPVELREDAWVLPPDESHVETLDLAEGALLDQLFYARCRPAWEDLELEVTHASGLPFSFDGERPFEFDVRLPASEQTGTLLLSAAFEPEDQTGWTEQEKVDSILEHIRYASPAPEPQPPTGFLHDVSAQLGLAFVHMEGPAEQLDIRPTMGPGAAWGDVDGDTFPDLYLVQGCGREGSRPPLNRLFHNDWGGGFTDWTEKSGTGDVGCGMGALFFDGEGDGDLDLYVANYGADVLFENSGDGTFYRRGAEIGVAADGWSSAVCAADVDLDGDLDLYVTSYLDYDESKLPAPEDLQRYQREDPVAMLPFAFPGAANVFLENDYTPTEVTRGTQLRYRDRTAELKLADEQGRGMQAVFWDFDRDGDPDLYVANDVSFNVLFRNDREAGFRDISFATGMDDPRGGMGIAIGDVDRDGDSDLFLTNWQLETNALYTNNLVTNSARSRVGTFRDRTVPSRLGPAGIGVTSWGTTFFDAENDGDLDLYVANGYTSPDYESTGICVGQRDHYFENDGTGRFRLAVEEAGSALAVALASRCVAPCDFDRDGRMDLVVTSNNGRARLLRNTSTGDGHWLGVHLRQDGPNPYAIGAEVTLETADAPLRGALFAGTSYLAGNPCELHFGLGTAEPDALEVRWPDGATTRHEVPKLDRWITISRP